MNNGNRIAVCTAFIRRGARGAETRHVAMIERLKELGFDVRAETCDIRPESSTTRLPVWLRKFRAGWRVANNPRQRRETFFAFEPYSFIGGALAARLRGNKAIYFCRNDQIYQEEELARIFGRKPQVASRLIVLQYLCRLLATTYVVQSQFAAERVRRRARKWPLVGSKEGIAILSNDVWLAIQAPPVARDEKTLRLAFVANPEWEKKGFFIVERLIASTAFQQADMTIDIVGEGDAFDRLRLSLPGLPEGRVSFSGFLPDINALRQTADVVLVPSVVDHFPNLVIECAALGLPMVLSEIEAHRNIFPEHAGYFPLDAEPVEIVRRIEGLRNPAAREAVIAGQQRDIAGLKDAWGAPLARIFEFDLQGAYGDGRA